MIDQYEFGRIVIDGKEFTQDLIVFPDKVKENWWRDQGHLLQVDDLNEVFFSKPEKLIVGTGFSGLMEVTDAVRRKVAELGIELIEKGSKEACAAYNEEKGKAVLAIHLTC
ncbi:MAG: hypothetical protein KJ709_02980 [Nanoarchaeota archaeon]|nr:hypothetical protein [Nanoarchaeota archaeon]